MSIKPLLRTLHADLFSRGERGNLVRSAGATASINVGYTVIGFLASLLYARSLGPHDYGLYAYVIACSQILIIPSSLGLSSYLVREGAKLPKSLLWLLRWADRWVWLTGAAAAAVLACGYLIPAAAGARWLFLIAAPLPLLTNLSAVRKALVQAHGWVARSQWPQLLLTPALTLAAIAALWWWRGSFTVEQLMIATVLALLPTIAINGAQLKMVVRNTIATEPAQAWIRAALPFMWLNAVYLINGRVDVVMLGSLKGAHEAGIYAIAVRGAELVLFFLTVAHLTTAPKVSSLYNTGDQVRLQRLTTATAVRMFLATLPLALFLIVGARFLLDLFYGPAFAQGAIVVRILAISQLIVVGVGPVGVLLNMTRHADLSAKAFTAGAGLNIALNAILIPLLGITGAALATAISTTSCYLLCWYIVRRKLALRPSFIGV